MTTRKVAILGVYVAIIIALTFAPFQVYSVKITVIPVFVVVATWHMGWLGGLTSSIAFGLMSYIAGITVLPSPIATVEILTVSRILLGITLVIVIKLMGKINLWKFTLSAILSIFLNTGYVTAMLFVTIQYNEIINVTFKAWIILIYINFFIELAVAITLSQLLYNFVRYIINYETNTKINTW